MTKQELLKIWKKRLAYYQKKRQDDWTDQDIEYIELSIDMAHYIIYSIEKM